MLYWLCVTSSTWISRSCGLRLVPERIEDGFPFIYMRKHCTRRWANHCPFSSLWLDVILFWCLLAREKRQCGLYGKSIQKQHKFSKGKIHFPIYNSRSNKFCFQKTCYMFELTRPADSYDQENYLNAYYASLLIHNSHIMKLQF